MLRNSKFLFLLFFSLSVKAQLFNLTQSGVFTDVQTKTTTYSATSTDSMILGSASGGAWTLTFPSASSVPVGKIIIAQKTDSSVNAITLSGTGMTTNTLNTQNETAWFQSDGTNWNQINRYTGLTDTSYAPTWTGSSANPSLGNGTFTGFWSRRSNKILVYIRIVFGSTTTSGTGYWIFTIPNSSSWTIATLATGNPGNSVGSGTSSQGGASDGNCVAFINTSTTISCKAQSSATNVGAGVPFTWANGNTFNMSFEVPITNFSP